MPPLRLKPRPEEERRRCRFLSRLFFDDDEDEEEEEEEEEGALPAVRSTPTVCRPGPGSCGGGFFGGGGGSMPLRTGVPRLEFGLGLPRLEAAAAAAAGSGGTGLSRTERGVLVRTDWRGVVGRAPERRRALPPTFAVCERRA